ncbi:VOC family protein [Kutzneria sp. CA-103260]|uniref:VOC family protein n=1 Tax=Kutzneria sp. CA-103260 TaxID=2802641 RepID=UPI001BA44577|nr:VOC family protein [Kutzneria sp. CA-103260]QUQ70161.1 VOC family protein [Kutzneria sp. CA-103260]
MATRLDNVVVDAVDPVALAGFWSAALGRTITHQDENEVDVGLPGFDLVFVPVAEPKTGQNRVHLDLASDSAEDQAAIVDRVLGLGARHIDIGQGDVPWVVLADPEGNEFCVLEPRDEYRGIGPVAAVVVAARDPLALARFWSEATGRPVSRIRSDWASLPADVGAWLEFIASPSLWEGKNRVHLDVRPLAGDDHAVEVARLRSAGAVTADVGQGDAPWVVLADPEENEFCVLRPAGSSIRTGD